MRLFPLLVCGVEVLYTSFTLLYTSTRVRASKDQLADFAEGQARETADNDVFA